MQVYTADETINMIVKAMLKQGKGAIINRGGCGANVCAYHLADGRGCAIGCLIPFSMSTASIESLSFNSIIEHTLSSQSEIVEFLLTTHPALAMWTYNKEDKTIRRLGTFLQKIHDDNANDVVTMTNKMKQFIGAELYSAPSLVKVV